MKHLKESILNGKWAEFREFLKRRNKGVRTGIFCLDNYLHGLGGLVNIQGETSSCKSVLGLQIAHHNLKEGMPVIMIDKENGDGRVITRLLCQANGISEEQFRSSSPEDKKKYVDVIAGYPLHLHTEEISKLQDFEERVRECWDLYQKPFMVLFDSIQAADKMSDDQRVSLEAWVYFLDRLKVEYQGKLTIVIISEKNRSSYNTQGTGGGKGSNVVDYKPETILDIKWDEQTDSFWVKVSKHRDGMKGGIFNLRKVFSNPENKRSFCFTLDETERESDEAQI